MKLPKIIMAPMAGITDAPYRKICREMGLELAYTEMVSSRGLIYDNERTKEYIHNPLEDTPLGIQVFGAEPNIMASATKRLEELTTFEFLDINMGCPARKIVSNGDGCRLMEDPKKAEAIVRAVRAVTTKPLSVKMRLGMRREEWTVLDLAKRVEAAGADFIMLHGRTGDMMYSGQADWEAIAEVKRHLSIPVIGNGDIFSLDDYIARQVYGVDGFLLARGIQGNPFLIRELLYYEETGKRLEPVSLEERIEVARRHLDYVISMKGPQALPEFRKHASWYFKGVPGSAKLRGQLSHLKSADEFRDWTRAWLDNQT